MFWQIVAFTFTDSAQLRRAEFEQALRALPGQIPELITVRVSRAADQPSVTGDVSAFSGESAFRRYLVHPAHQPISDMAQALCDDIHRLLMHTEDDAELLHTAPPAPMTASPHPIPHVEGSQ